MSTTSCEDAADPGAGPPVATLRTARLDLVAASLAHLDAELESPGRLAALLGAQVPEDWPPGEYDRPAIELFRATMAERPEVFGWLGWYAILRAGAGRPAIVVAAAGYLGPPDAEGAVEVGYSVAAAHRSRGYASEVVGALVARAFSRPDVARVIAHTSADNLASSRVLERCGFSPDGPGAEPGTLRFVLSR
jgi:[ribosomal protein S5]-alanine N-acetyltransferase